MFNEYDSAKLLEGKNATPFVPYRESEEVGSIGIQSLPCSPVDHHQRTIDKCKDNQNKVIQCISLVQAAPNQPKSNC